MEHLFSVELSNIWYRGLIETECVRFLVSRIIFPVAPAGENWVVLDENDDEDDTEEEITDDVADHDGDHNVAEVVAVDDVDAVEAGDILYDLDEERDERAHAVEECEAVHENTTQLK